MYVDDLGGMGTKPRHQESVSQSIPSITVKLVVMVTGDKAWSLLESSACLFRMTGRLAGTAKDPLGQARVLSHKYKTFHNQIPPHLTLCNVQSNPDSLEIYSDSAECRKAPERAQLKWACILNLFC